MPIFGNEPCDSLPENRDHTHGPYFWDMISPLICYARPSIKTGLEPGCRIEEAYVYR